MQKSLFYLSIFLLLVIGININTYAATTPGSEININRQHFPDDSFRKLVKKYDSNKDGKLSKSERAKVKTLYIRSDTLKVYILNEFDCKGLQYFYNLKNLTIGTEDKTVKIDNVKYILRLKNINKLSLCGELDQRKFDFKKMKHLKHLALVQTNVKSVNVKQNKNLKYINISGNYDLKKLDLSKNMKLKNIKCYVNRISKLSLPKSNSVVELDVSCNALKKISVSSFTNLKVLDISSTLIKSIDISKNLKLKRLSANVSTKIIKGKKQVFDYITDNFTYKESLMDPYI